MRAHRFRALCVCALVAGVWDPAASAQTPPAGWTLVVRIVPNPLPIGRCAGISIEPQDPQGYRTTTMSNGQPLDFHQFQYASTNLTDFQWQNGNPVSGYLCAPAGASAASTTVTVTLPDGLSGSVGLTSVAPGQSVTPVVYAPQAPLRIPGVPPPKGAGSLVATTGGGAPGGAPSSTAAGTAVSLPGGSASTIARKPTNVALQTPTGASPAGASTGRLAPLVVTTAALSMTGGISSLAPISVTASALTMIGGMSTLAPLVVTAPGLSMIGGMSTLKPLSVASPALTMTGPF